jgi:hypothetical protein
MKTEFRLLRLICRLALTALAVSRIIPTLLFGGSVPDEPATTPVVRLIQAGREPRRELRLAPKAGLRQTMVVNFKMQITQQGKAESSVKMPEIKMVCDMKVTRVESNGDVRCEFEYGRPEVVAGPDQTAALQELEKRLQSLQGVKGTAVVTSRNAWKEMKFIVPLGADEEFKSYVESMKQSLCQAGSQLPEELVGAGAKWEMITPVTANGIKMEQKMVTELLSVAGDSCNFAMQIKQSVDHQTIQKGGAAGEISALTKGSGHTELNLSEVFPRLATVATTSDMRVLTEAGGKKAEYSMKMDVKVKIHTQ